MRSLPQLHCEVCECIRNPQQRGSGGGRRRAGEGHWAATASVRKGRARAVLVSWERKMDAASWDRGHWSYTLSWRVAHQLLVWALHFALEGQGHLGSAPAPDCSCKTKAPSVTSVVISATFATAVVGHGLPPAPSSRSTQPSPVSSEPSSTVGLHCWHRCPEPPHQALGQHEFWPDVGTSGEGCQGQPEGQGP